MAPHAFALVQSRRTARERACANDPRAFEYPHPGPGMGTDGTSSCWPPLGLGAVLRFYVLSFGGFGSFEFCW